ncbi:hypothetical protein Efla_007884 [Eimeria flavescens]
MPPPAGPPLQFALPLGGSRKPSAQPPLLLLQPLPLLLLLLLVVVGCTGAPAAGQPLLRDEKTEFSRLETHTVEGGEGTSWFEDSEIFIESTEASVEDAAIPPPLSSPFRSPNTTTQNAAAEGGKSRQQTRWRRAAGVGAAAVGILLLLGVVRLLARRQPAAPAELEAAEAGETAKGEAAEPEAAGGLVEEKQRAAGAVTLQRAAAQAKRLMHFLDGVAIDSSRLTEMLGTAIDPGFVKQIELTLAEARQQLQRLQQLQQQQEQQQQDQLQQEQQQQQEGEARGI